MRVIHPSDLKERTEELLESLSRGEEPFFVSDDGDPKAVLLAVSDWENIQSALATLEEKMDEGSRESLRRALEDIANGRLTLHEDVIRSYREAHPE